MKVYSQKMPVSQLIHHLSPKGKRTKPKLQKPKQHSNSPPSRVSAYHRPQQYASQSINDFQEYSLRNLIKSNKNGKQNSRSSRVSNSKRQQSKVQPGYVVRVAYAQNHAIHIDNDFLALMRDYSDKQVAFVSVYGAPRAGKSTLLDTVLQLSEIISFQNVQFQRTASSRVVSLYTYSIPFQKHNKRIFLLDIQNFICSQLLSIDQKMILNLMTVLSSSIVILPQPKDMQAAILTNSEQHFKQRMQHMLYKSRPTQPQFGYWPQQIYCLYRSFERNSIKGNQKIQLLFKQFSFLIIHDAFNPGQLVQNNQFRGETSAFRSVKKSKRILNLQYLKSVSMLFRNIFGDIQVKKFQNLRYTGKTLISLSTNFMHYINKNTALQNYDQVEMQQVFHEVMKEAYHSLYNYQLIKYNHRLERMLNTQEPRKLDELIQIFQEASSDIIQDFILFNAHKDLRQKYQAKLLKSIDQKQRMLLQINQKKTKKMISKQLESSKFVFSVTDFKGQLWNLRTKFRRYDHGKAQMIGNRLKKVIADMQQNPSIQEPQQEHQKYQSMKKRKEQLARMLRSQEIQQSIQRRRQAQLQQEQQKLQMKQQQLKKRIQLIQQQVSQVKIKKSRGQKFQKPSFLRQERQQEGYEAETAKFIINEREEKVEEMKKQLAQLKKVNRKHDLQIEASEMQLQFFDPNKFEDEQIKKRKKWIEQLIESQQNCQIELLQIQNHKNNKGKSGIIGKSNKSNGAGINYSTRPELFQSQNVRLQKEPAYGQKREIKTTTQMAKKDSKSPVHQQFSSPRGTQLNNYSKLKKKPIRIVEQRDLQENQMQSLIKKQVKNKKGQIRKKSVVK